MTKTKLADVLHKTASTFNAKRDDAHKRDGLTREQRVQKALIAERKALANRLWTDIKKDIREKSKRGGFFGNYRDQSEDVAYLVKTMAEGDGFKVEITQRMDNDGDDGDGRQWYKNYNIQISWQ